MAWTFAFAILSVLTTFALGLALAVIFNDPRVKAARSTGPCSSSRTRSLGFLAALVWKGMLNRDFGIINNGVLAVPTSTGSATVTWRRSRSCW